MSRAQHYSIEWEASAAKVFKKIKDASFKESILSILENELAYNPLLGKPLKGPFEGIRSLRVGVVRILYKYYANRLVIAILTIDHRKQVYQ